VDIQLHIPGRTAPETVTVEETALVGVLLAGHDGDAVWTEEVEVAVDLTVTFQTAGIRAGHHVHRGPCHRVAVTVALDGRDATVDTGPATTVGTVLRRAAGQLGLAEGPYDAVDRATGQPVGHGTHVGSLPATGTCHTTLDGHRREVRIVVNARPREVSAGDVTFDQVVALAFETPPPGANLEFTVTYRHGEPAQPKGSLLAGKSVRVREGMVFVVTATDKS